MVSFCIKSLNKTTLDELERYFDSFNLPNIYYSQKKLPKFHNLIFHYVGNSTDNFYIELSQIMAKFIIDTFEKKIIRSSLKYDFFYFSTDEREIILENLDNILSSKEALSEKYSILQKCIYEFHKKSHKYNIDGFMNFRISPYKEYLNIYLDQAIHKYVLDKEYCEYVDLLREYIYTQTPKTQKLHLIYTQDEALLLDELGNIVTTTASKKYLSDISFSKNDFILNSILSFIPGYLIIHSFGHEDKFIKFLKLIFEEKYIICDNCDICHSFNINSQIIPNKNNM